MDRRAWWATVLRGHKGLDKTEQFEDTNKQMLATVVNCDY